MEINILGHTYELTGEEGMFFNTGNYGKHSYPKLEITYDPDMKPTVFKEAIFHELHEAINFWLNIKLEHHQIVLMSAALFGILRNNKELQTLLFEETEKKDAE